MKKLIFALSLLALAGCAAVHVPTPAAEKQTFSDTPLTAEEYRVLTEGGSGAE